MLQTERDLERRSVFYFGNLDPPGDDMDDHRDNALRYFGLEDIDLQRIAVTEEQLEEFNLPPMSKSKDSIDKINHDTRKDGFIKKYGNLLFI